MQCSSRVRQLRTEAINRRKNAQACIEGENEYVEAIWSGQAGYAGQTRRASGVNRRAPDL